MNNQQTTDRKATMTHTIQYLDPDGFEQSADALSTRTRDEARDLISLAHRLTDQEAMDQLNKMVTAASSKRPEMWVQRDIPYSNLLFERKSGRWSPANPHKTPIDLAPSLLDRLDAGHNTDAERLDMTTANPGGLAEFCDEVFPVLTDYWDSGECDIEPMNLDAYDEKAGGYRLSKYPGQVIDPDSPEGEEYMKSHKIQCTESAAATAFDEALHRFEAGDPVFSERTAGNVAYWMTIWFTPEEKMRALAESADEDAIAEHARDLLGLSEEQMNALTNPSAQPEAAERARPAHAAAVLRRFADTGRMSWDGIVPEHDFREYP